VADTVPTGLQTRRVFLDPAVEAEYWDKGYVVIPFLDATDLDELRAHFAATHPEIGTGFEADSQRDEPEYKRELFAVLSRIFQPHLDEVFDDYVPFLSNFVKKWPGEYSTMSLHQDWTFVDEPRYRAAAVWCPLVDVTVEAGNGPIHLVPGCQRHDTLRGSGTLLSYWEDLGPVLAARGLPPIEARAGDAVVWDTSMAHYSADNTSDAPRVAAVMAVGPREAPIVHFHGNQDGTIERYEVDADYLIEHSFVTFEPDMPGDAAPFSTGLVETDRGPLTREQILELSEPYLTEPEPEPAVEPAPEPEPEPEVAVQPAPEPPPVMAPPRRRSLARRAAGKAKRTLRRTLSRQ
jgi:hypothetical protein